MNIYEKIFEKHGLSKTQQEIISLAGRNKKILEVGPSTGYMTKMFLQNNCLVDCVETDKRALAKLPKGVRKILNYSIEDEKIKANINKDYDFIVLADVLEHLVDPSKVLRNLRQIALEKTRLIISLPNIASWVMRKQLFFKGDFEYQQSGILDKTHLHFYTVNTLPKLLSENGWGIEQITGTITRLPFEGLISRIPIFGWIFENFLYKKIVEKYKNLTYFHFLITAFKK